MENKALMELKESIEREIKKVTKKADITPGELDNMNKALCAMESIKRIESMDGGMGGEQSGRSYARYYRDGYRDGYARDYDRDYARDESYRRGRSEVTGRYISRDEAPHMESGRYRSRDDGYSGHSINDRMVDQLERMMDEAQNDYEREQVQAWIEKLRAR